MQVTSPTAATAATTTTDASASALPQATLGQDDFLKLLTVQMANQDPSSPMDDTAFISQMTSFTSLQQMKTLTTSFDKFQSNSAQVNAQAYLGKQVTVSDKDLGLISGAVSAVKFQGGDVSLTVNGKDYTIDSVTQLTAAAASAPASTATTNP